MVVRDGANYLRCNLRDFPDKVIHDPDFLHLLAVHLLNLADQDFTDKPVQHCLIQFLDGGIAPDFLDEGADFTLLGIRPALHHCQVMQALLVGFLLLFQRRRQLHKPLLGQDAFCLIGIQAQKHPVNFLIPGFQPLAFFLRLRSVHQIPALHSAAEPLVERIGVLHGLRRQFLYILQHQIVQTPCLDFVAGADLAAHAVVSLADIVRLVNRFPHLAGEAVLSGSAHLLIPHLHGLPAGGTVDKAVEQVVEGAGITLNGRPAVNQFLHLFPFLRRHNRLMAALNDLPFLTGDNVIGIGADAFLVRPADKMCALIKGISQDMADPCAPPPLKISNSFNYNFPLTF